MQDDLVADIRANPLHNERFFMLESQHTTIENFSDTGKGTVHQLDPVTTFWFPGPKLLGRRARLADLELEIIECTVDAGKLQ